MSGKDRFIGDLKFRALPRWELLPGQRPQYAILEPFGFISREHGTITVPAGMLTDFASVPNLTKFIIDDNESSILFGATIHDWLYQSQGLCEGRNMTRKQCDEVLAEAMEACGAPAWRRAVVYAAVRVGGSFAWES